MSKPTPPSPRQPLVAAWTAQMIGTLVLAGAVLVFVRTMGSPFGEGDPTWRQYALLGVLVGVAPALLYLRTFKPLLDADEAAVKQRGGTPDPGIRAAFLRAIAVGGALCEIPMAMGVVQLLLGGEMRWFLGATLITVALRLSYRPFTRS